MNKAVKTAVIQAGGLGTRLRELTKNQIPKPLLQLDGKPMITHQIDCLKEQGITDFVIITGYLGEKLCEHFGDGSSLGVKISYIHENQPLGSAGALYYLKDMIKDDFMLIFGDVMFDIDVGRMVSFHLKNNALATLLVHPNSHPYDSDLIMSDKNGCVTGFDSKNNKRDYLYDNCVNAGIYILSPGIFKEITEPVKTDLEKDLLFPLIDSGRIYAYRTTEYVKDAGTVDRFLAVSEDHRKGLWHNKRLSNPQKCIFIDRDGTLNKHNGLISDISQIVLEDNAAEAVRLINTSGYLAICVTNQPVVARGMCSIEEVEDIHRKMCMMLGENGAYLDDIVFCPHHPDKGYPEENPEYKIKCSCRKPSVGMIEEMTGKYNIDLSESYIIGDTTVDIQTGKNAGIKTVLVHTGEGGKDSKYSVTPDIEAEDILSAVKKILL